MKKYVLLTLLASMFCLAACGGGEGGGGGGGGGSSKIKLKARFHVEKSSKEGTAYKQLIDAFNEENRGEITVTASFVARTAGEDAFERQLYTDKIDGTLPDLFSFDSPNCGTYAKAEYLLNISDYFTETELNKFVNTNKYNGQLYGLPIQESSAGFYYNKQIFSAAGINVDGITAENPWTVTRFKEVCQQLKD